MFLGNTKGSDAQFWAVLGFRSNQFGSRTEVTVFREDPVTPFREDPSAKTSAQTQGPVVVKSRVHKKVVAKQRAIARELISFEDVNFIRPYDILQDYFGDAQNKSNKVKKNHLTLFRNLIRFLYLYCGKIQPQEDVFEISKIDPTKISENTFVGLRVAFNVFDKASAQPGGKLPLVR